MAAGQERQELEEITQEVQEDKHIFNISDTPDPELNPVSNNFNIDKYNAYIERLKENLIDFVDKLAQETGKEPTEKIFAEFIVTLDGLQRLVESSSVYPAGQLQSMKHHMERIANGLREDAETISKIRPYLLEEIRKPKYEGKTLEELSVDDKVWGDIVWSAIRAAEEAGTDSGIEETAKLLPLLQSVIPKSHIMPNNSLMNTLQQKPSINAGAFDMVVSKGTKNRKEITNYTIINYESENTGITITNNKLSEYERQVSDAIISLWEQAKEDGVPPIFSTDMIYRAMPGSGDKASAQQRGAITRTIEKLRNLHIYIDATEEMKKRGLIGEKDKFTIDDFYLSAKKAEYIKAKNGGQTISAYIIQSEPIVLMYARMTKQIITIPAKYIAIKKIKRGIISNEIIAMNPDRQAMSGYLIRQIGWMKHDLNNKVASPRSNIILFDTLFRETDTYTESRTQASRNRDFIYSVLDYEIAAGYIISYEKQLKGRSIAGVKIIF